MDVQACRGGAADTRAIWQANASDWIELSQAGFDVYRDLVNTPAFFGLLPSVAGMRVGGHEILPIGGHETARWWPTVLPAGGQWFCPR